MEDENESILELNSDKLHLLYQKIYSSNQIILRDIAGEKGFNLNQFSLFTLENIAKNHGN